MNLAKLLTGGSTTVASVVWPIIIGVFIAILVSHLNKKTVGRLVKKLLDAKADSPESAKSLSELGFGSKSFLKYALRPSSTLSTIILKEDSSEKYYIPEDKAYRAETTYSPDGSKTLTVVIALVLLIIAGVGLNNLIPYIIKLATGIFV